MSDDAQDIFGKIDAMLEKRAGFSPREGQPPHAPDFPTLTDIIQDGEVDPALAERRAAERRAGERRHQPERRQTERNADAEQAGRSAHHSFSDAQFERFMNRFEKKLEDLFIRQQLRMEESIRHAVREELAKLLSEDV